MATPLLEQIEAEVESQNPTRGRERACLWLEATVRHLESAPEELSGILNRMATIQEPSGYQAGKNWALLVRGWKQLKDGENEQAQACFNEALEQFEQYEDRKGLARGLNGLGVVALYQSRYDEALKTLAKARSSAELASWPEMIAVIDSNQGLVHLELGDYPEAICCFEASKRDGKLMQNNLAVTDCHLASAYAELDREEEALELLLKTIELCRREGFRITEIDALGRYGRILARRGEKEAALKAFSEALGRAEALGNRRLLAENGIERGKLLTSLGEHDQAREALAEAERVALEDRLPGLRAKALAIQAQTFAARGEWEQAYGAQRQASELEAAVFTEKVAGQAAGARAEREAAENEAYRRQLRRLALIADIGRAVASAMDAESVGRILHESLSALMPMTSFGLALVREERGELEFTYFADEARHIEPFSIPLTDEDSLAAYCARSGEDLRIDDIDREYERYVRHQRRLGKSEEGRPIKSILCCPVAFHGQQIAVVTAQSEGIAAYEPHHLEMLRAISAYVGVALQNARLFAEAKTAADTDPLTGIMNRRRIAEAFSREASLARRNATCLSLIMFDLDHFKAVNDRWGHGVGDQVLKEAAAAAGRALRLTDYLARYGGEEFLILLPNTGIQGATVVAERIRRAFESNRLPFAAEEFTVTASFGVAVLGPEDDFERLVGRADQALYKAKEDGRNRVETTLESGCIPQPCADRESRS